MLFTEPAFLFLFLPLVLGLHWALPIGARNIFLMLASLYFYAVGEREYLLILIGYCLANYIFAILIYQSFQKNSAKIFLFLGIASNLGLLFVFKYANFFNENSNLFLDSLGIGLPDEVLKFTLPIGISFYTFQSMSYLIDVYRKEVKANLNPFDVTLYISLFPQLIAGPIVRYIDISNQIQKRKFNLNNFVYGIERFSLGLGKKMILANGVALPVDSIFSIPANQLTFGLAWVGIIGYTLQIYFDFSGYSDMAIGLGRMLGFEFLENFNYPYISHSITEFWRRWHISLSTWFRDYLYIPLGGNRGSTQRVAFNLIVVFGLCGLWHGASWNFLIWGLFHGLFLIIERRNRQFWLNQHQWWQHIYLLLVVMVGWVFFRAETLTYAVSYLQALVGLGQGDGIAYHLSLFLDNYTYWVMTFAIIACLPIFPWLLKIIKYYGDRLHSYLYLLIKLTKIGYISLILFASICLSAAGTYNPFIYFRF